MDEEDYGDWGDEDDDAQVNDDSTAWKVRKGAVKVINSVIKSCPVQLKKYWRQIVILL